MILKKLQKNVASEAKHQRLMKVKLKDVQFRTDKYNAQRKWGREKLHFTNATVTKATKYSNSEPIYSFKLDSCKNKSVSLNPVNMNNIHWKVLSEKTEDPKYPDLLFQKRVKEAYLRPCV